MTITEEEISLCKQVAEKHRKEIKYGDWYLTITTSPLDKDDKEESICLNAEKREINSIEETKKDRVFYNEYIPLWTISDCLEFLEGKGFDLDFDFTLFVSGNWRFIALAHEDKEVRGEGRTRLASCLKAVLAVV